MRIATYNVEWFNTLFDDENRPVPDLEWSSRYNVKRREQLEAIAIVLTALDADAIMIIEAPDSNPPRDSVTALENFARHYGLRTSAAISGFQNDTQQEISMLYDPAKLTLAHDPQGQPNAGGEGSPRFDATFRLDLDIDALPDKVIWSKPPLELAATSATGRRFRMIGVHAKSKAPHGARNKDEATKISIENRRKQLAQCIWLRARVEEHLNAGEAIMVMGDFNDGPGLDEYENLFGRSGVEIVLGENGKNCLFDPHARPQRRRPGVALPTSARFYVHAEKRYLCALLDYIMVSADLRMKSKGWRIWHPFEDPDIYRVPELREALLAASDHFPVTLDIDL